MNIAQSIVFFNLNRASQLSKEDQMIEIIKIGCKDYFNKVEKGSSFSFYDVSESLLQEKKNSEVSTFINHLRSLVIDHIAMVEPYLDDLIKYIIMNLLTLNRIILDRYYAPAKGEVTHFLFHQSASLSIFSSGELEHASLQSRASLSRQDRGAVVATTVNQNRDSHNDLSTDGRERLGSLREQVSHQASSGREIIAVQTPISNRRADARRVELLKNKVTSHLQSTIESLLLLQESNMDDKSAIDTMIQEICNMPIRIDEEIEEGVLNDVQRRLLDFDRSIASLSISSCRSN